MNVICNQTKQQKLTSFLFFFFWAMENKIFHFFQQGLQNFRNLMFTEGANNAKTNAVKENILNHLLIVLSAKDAYHFIGIKCFTKTSNIYKPQLKIIFVLDPGMKIWKMRFDNTIRQHSFSIIRQQSLFCRFLQSFNAIMSDDICRKIYSGV